MMEFLECGKAMDIIRNDAYPKSVLRDFQRSAHHRLQQEGVSYCALVYAKNDDVTVIMGDDREEIETWIGIRKVDAELLELRDIMFH